MFYVFQFNSYINIINSENTTVNNITILGTEVCWPYAMFAMIEIVSCVIVLKQVIALKQVSVDL